LQNLGGLYGETGDYNQSLIYLRQAREIELKYLGPHDEKNEMSLNDLALVARDLGDFEGAEVYLRQAREIAHESGREHHPSFARTLNNTALVYAAEERFDEAHELFLQALEIRRLALGDAHPLCGETLSNLAWLYFGAYRFEQAVDSFIQATTADDHLIAQASSVASARQWGSTVSTARQDLSGLLGALLHMEAGQRSLPLVFELVQRRKAIELEAWQLLHQTAIADHYPELHQEIDDLNSHREELIRQTLDGPGDLDAKAHQKRLNELYTGVYVREGKLTSKFPYMPLTRAFSAKTDEIAAALPPKSALVEFVRLSLRAEHIPLPANASDLRADCYLAFVLVPGRTPLLQVVDLGEAGSIHAALFRWLNAITGEQQDDTERGQINEVTDLRSSLQALKQRIGGQRSRPQRRLQGLMEGSALRKLIFDPLVLVLGEVKRLLIAPDSDISLVPFEALPLHENRYLLDDYQISYLTVGRDVLTLSSTRERTPNRPLVISDPDFDYGSDSVTNFVPGVPFGALTGARKEGKVIARILNAELLSGAAALKNILRDHRSPAIMHLSTHGIFSDPRPARSHHVPFISSTSDGSRLDTLSLIDNPLLRSAIALAGANVWAQYGHPPPKADNGLLTAEDVAGLDLLDTDLVVLSACDTGLGQAKAGQGVFGFRRAFVIGGARTLVMSLWKVPDKQTCLLMELFYQNMLEKGFGRAEALRQAQLSMRQQYPKRPFYWGAFICQGDPGPLGLG
jgi:CHAT domain-containing protein/tetratricopeptide (TPR) repeat protein